MSSYLIASRAGLVYGVFRGADEREAFMEMLAASGDSGNYGEPHVGTESDWHITPVDWQLSADDDHTHVVVDGTETYRANLRGLTAQQVADAFLLGYDGDYAIFEVMSPDGDPLGYYRGSANSEAEEVSLEWFREHCRP